MTQPPKSSSEQIADLRALIERMKAELVGLERLQERSAEISAGLDSALAQRADLKKP